MFAPAAEARAVSECIGKDRIRRVFFRATHSLEFQAAELAPSGGTSIAASTGHAEIGRRGRVRRSGRAITVAPVRREPPPLSRASYTALQIGFGVLSGSD